jgi:TM2 domain-containing membrane protein YozV
MKTYFVAEAGQQRGPFPLDQMSAQGVRPDAMIWAEGMPNWMPARDVPEVSAAIGGGALPPSPGQTAPWAAPGGQHVSQGGAYAPGGPPVQYAAGGPPASSGDNNKLAAGLCGILIGGLGIHKFLLGYTTAGVIMLLSTLLTCGFGGIVMHIIGIVEGIIYLTKSDAEFYETYIVRKKEWF